MTERRLDLREIPPPKRHPKVFDAFEELEGGEALTLVNDHAPTPLYHQMNAEVDSLDAEGIRSTASARTSSSRGSRRSRAAQAVASSSATVSVGSSNSAAARSPS
jgi:uncharacterized protein (DUF2249 family)